MCKKMMKDPTDQLMRIVQKQLGYLFFEKMWTRLREPMNDNSQRSMIKGALRDGE